MGHPSGKFFDKMNREGAVLRETNKAHSAFLAYAAMGPSRSLDKLCAQMGAKPGYARVLYEWSRKHHWQRRVREYDVEAAQEELRQADKELRKMNDRHAQTAMSAQVTALEYVMWQIKNKKLSSLAAVTMLKDFFKLERDARGATSDHTRVEVSGPAGGPVELDSYVRVYLPQKDALPNVVSSDPATPLALPAGGESVEDIKRRLAEQISAYLQRDGA